jgi:hypothetical protein
MTVVCIGFNGMQRVSGKPIVRIIVGGVGMYGADSPSIKLMEPPMIGRCTGIIAVKMPFVDKTRAVAGSREDCSNGGVL